MPAVIFVYVFIEYEAFKFGFEFREISKLLINFHGIQLTCSSSAIVYLTLRWRIIKLNLSRKISTKFVYIVQ